MISIAIGYFNRKEQFLKTLESIKRSKITDIQIVVVDDGSDENNRIEDLVEKYNLTFFRFEPHEKNWTNPCVAYNKAFSLCVHDKIIIQNPECYHLDDICLHAYNNVIEGSYITYACYSIDYSTYSSYIDVNQFDSLIRSKIINRSVTTDFDLGWYNHSVYRPVAYHFTSAISKSDLEKLNGFDLRYSQGVAYDDNEFLHRIRLLTNNNILFVDNKISIHQWHTKGSVNPQLIEKNRKLLELTYKENKIRANE